MGRVRIVGRRGRGHCAYCRDALSDDEREACSGCGVTLHAACRDELGGCPTLGCAEASARTQEDRAARREGREGRLRRTERGRVTRDPPGLFARIGPYMRMVVRTVWHVAFSLLIAAALLYAITHPAKAFKFFTGPEAIPALFRIGLALLFGGVGAFLAYDWLSRLPRFWTRFSELLDDGEVTPMRFSTFTQSSGKSTTTHVRLTATGGRTREMRVEGFLVPFWLTWRDGQTVYVHGENDDEPCVLEFEDGTLALLDPD